jgi:multisubunit Na+/H+ antiporter MnhF subunit
MNPVYIVLFGFIGLSVLTVFIIFIISGNIAVRVYLFKILSVLLIVLMLILSVVTQIRYMLEFSIAFAIVSFTAIFIFTNSVKGGE